MSTNRRPEEHLEGSNHNLDYQTVYKHDMLIRTLFLRQRTALPSFGREPQLPFSPLLGDGREPSSSGREPLFLPSAENRNFLFHHSLVMAENPLPPAENRSSFLRQRTATSFFTTPWTIFRSSRTIEDIVQYDSKSYRTIGTRTTLPSSGREPQLPFSPLLGDGREPSSSGREPLFLPSAENRNFLFHHSLVMAENPLPPAENRSSFLQQRTATSFFTTPW
ncbi:hypothetical protein M5K25_008086 [Dendrobium thyrsiflorum]|uniref:Uncharacterized protein n=1 Tax=Dendrobium thyrsiflorum TaxID=117978 RepID=A0ABD0V7R3_DENTH